MNRVLRWLPAAVAIVALAAVIGWYLLPSGKSILPRIPGADRLFGESNTAEKNPFLHGTVTMGPGKPGGIPGAWPRFRGANLDNISTDPTPLARGWSFGGPRELWSIDVGEGYAGAAIFGGRVFLMDYDQEIKADALRCLSLEDGREIWRFSYPITIKRNHGITRTVPTVTPESVVAIGPKCHVVCVETVTGAFRWGLDLVAEFGAEVPPWYAGQCPLIEGDRVILAPGSTDAMMMAVELGSGTVVWKTPGPRGWKMSHSSIVPIEFAGRRLLVYCASNGVVIVDANDGALLWRTDEWRIRIATIPCPVDLGDGRIFLTGGYNAGSMLIQLTHDGAGIRGEIVYRLDPKVFGATQHAPVFHQNHLFGTRADGRFVCLSPDGQVIWTSGPGSNFGLGPFMLADGMFLAMDDSGEMTLIEASPVAFNPLAGAQVLDGPESWGPLALASGRLIARDLNKIICLDVRAR